MKNLKNLFNVVLIVTTVFFTSCSDDDEVKKQISIQDSVVAIDENPTNGQVVGIVQTDESGASGFSITSQTPAGALSIDPSTGELTVADATLFDFETNPVITATISVVDGVNTATVTINLNNVAEISDLTIDFDENPTNGQTIGTVPTDGSGVLSIASQTPAGALSINPSTGELTVADAALFDFETNPVITANISVDNSVNSTTAIATINLNNINELSAQDLDVTIDENPTNGQSIGIVQATGDGTLSFSITSQTPSGALSIDANTGELTVADVTLFDFETNPVITANILIGNSVSTESAVAAIDLNDLHEIGEFKFGGVIFWVNAANDEGYVVSMSDQSSGAEWGCSTTSIAGAYGEVIGTGAANTLAIVSSCPTPGIAADIANDISNGYSDWFLPSKDELNEVYVNKTIINATIVANGGTALSNYYWTSTEFNSHNVWIQSFSNGSQAITGKSILSRKVRAVRAWTDF